MSGTVRVFVDGTGIDAPVGCTARDAVGLRNYEDAQAVDSGRMLITDSRGLPVPPTTFAFNGAVFRLVPNRANDTSDPAARFDE